MTQRQAWPASRTSLASRTALSRESPGKGEKTRHQILDVAADLASVAGLEGVTIGSLAKALDMSKSGLFAHFGSKEELQLAVVDLVRAMFEQRVLRAAENVQPGLQRLLGMLLAWADHIDHSEFRGGCFFAAAAAEFDDRPGPVRDEITRLSKSWIDFLIHEAEVAKSGGQIRPRADPNQIVFEVHAFVQEANWGKQLLRDKHAFDRARRAIRSCLEREATAKGRRDISRKDK